MRELSNFRMAYSGVDAIFVNTRAFLGTDVDAGY
jgi:hypothetical protein